MVKYSDVMRCNPPEKRPPIKGNYMFPSFNEVKTRRRIREQKLSQQCINLPGLFSHPLTDLHIEDRQHFKKGPWKYVFESGDMAFKDARQQEEERRQQMQRTIAAKQREDETAMEANMQQWRERFGHSEQADRMANALRKLHAAYAHGVAWQRRQNLADDPDLDGNGAASE